MKLSHLLTTLACAALAAFNHLASAAPGDLDLTFGGTGKVTTDFGGDSSAYGLSLAIYGESKIVVAGYSYQTNGYNFAVARYNPDGSLDLTFNGTGKATTDFSTIENNSDDIALSVAVGLDGKIVLAGSTSIDFHNVFAVARYNVDGTLDTSFGGTGKVTTRLANISGYGEALSVAVQGNGKVVVTGTVTSPLNGSGVGAVVRYNTDGTLDRDFNGTGKIINETVGYLRILAVQIDAKIVVWGYSKIGTGNISLIRYNSDGTLDDSFGSLGMVTITVGSNFYGSSLATQGDGRILVAGGFYNGSNDDFALMRFNADGSLDLTFNGTGKVTTDFGNSLDSGHGVAVQDDGKIVVAGATGSVPRNQSTEDFALLRYNADGSLDSTFNGTGKVITAFSDKSYDFETCMDLQGDGKIVVGGFSNYRFALVRYEGYDDTDGDGIPDRYETGTGIYVSPTNTGTDPNKADTDGDGLNDGQEINAYHTNPNVKDTDGDGFDDGFEVETGFNPTSAASAPETFSTILTAVEFRFGAALGISYRIEASTNLTNWTTIETPVIGTGGVITRFYSIEGQPKRFFRSRRN